MNHVANKKGFTLIELMLAMAFLSVLLLAIALTVIQIGKIYNRGITLTEVNQAARSIGDELTRGISSSQAFSLNTKYLTTSAGGRLCLGQYSYIWNYGKALQNNDQNLVGYDAPAGKDPIRFIKLPDAAGLYCAQTNGVPTYRNIRVADTAAPIELLKTGDRTLSIHQFSITSGANAQDSVTGQQLYSLSFTIGTSEITALTSDQSACLPPSDPNSDFSYCTVQQFSLVVRAGDRVN